MTSKRMKLYKWLNSIIIEQQINGLFLYCLEIR